MFLRDFKRALIRTFTQTIISREITYVFLTYYLLQIEKLRHQQVNSMKLTTKTRKRKKSARNLNQTKTEKQKAAVTLNFLCKSSIKALVDDSYTGRKFTVRKYGLNR